MIIENLKIALSKISKRHYKVINPVTRLINGAEKKIKYSRRETEPEKTFVDQLTTKYSIEVSKIDNFPDEDVDPRMYPQIELYKKILKHDGTEKLIEDFNLKDGLIPDIIFHKNQEDNNPKNQVLILECKINSNLSFEEFEFDIVKLYLYKTELYYQNCIFLIANNLSLKINDFVDKFKNKHCELNLEQIEIWIINHNEELIIKTIM